MEIWTKMKTRKQRIIEFFKKWEGGYVNHPLDYGGCTNMGVTIKTFKRYFGEEKTCEDLKNITDDEWYTIFEDGYYKPSKADKIEDDKVALLVVDFCWNSGTKTAIKRIQKCLGVPDDGIVGKVTLNALNADCFDKLFEMRKEFYQTIVNNRPSQQVFLKGWLNRLEDVKRF